MDSKALGANIQKYRLANNMTQEAVAEKSGLSTVYFRQIELGHKTPRLETFLRIAEVLNTPTDKLLSGNVSWTDEINTYEVIEKLDGLSNKKRTATLEMLDMYIKTIKDL